MLLHNISTLLAYSCSVTVTVTVTVPVSIPVSVTAQPASAGVVMQAGPGNFRFLMALVGVYAVAAVTAELEGAQLKGKHTGAGHHEKKHPEKKSDSSPSAHKSGGWWHHRGAPPAGAGRLLRRCGAKGGNSACSATPDFTGSWALRTASSDRCTRSPPGGTGPCSSARPPV
jgi:hypothetical protein